MGPLASPALAGKTQICVRDRLQTLLKRDGLTLEDLAKLTEFDRTRFHFSDGDIQHVLLDRLSPDNDYLFFRLENGELKLWNDSVGKPVATGATIQYKTMFLENLDEAIAARNPKLRDLIDVRYDDYKGLYLRFRAKRGEFFGGAGYDPTKLSREIDDLLQGVQAKTQADFARRAGAKLSDADTAFVAGLSGAERTPAASELMARWSRNYAYPGGSSGYLSSLSGRIPEDVMRQFQVFKSLRDTLPKEFWARPYFRATAQSTVPEDGLMNILRKTSRNYTGWEDEIINEAERLYRDLPGYKPLTATEVRVLKTLEETSRVLSPSARAAARIPHSAVDAKFQVITADLAGGGTLNSHELWQALADLPPTSSFRDLSQRLDMAVKAATARFDERRAILKNAVESAIASAERRLGRKLGRPNPNRLFSGDDFMWKPDFDLHPDDWAAFRRAIAEARGVDPSAFRLSRLEPGFAAGDRLPLLSFGEAAEKRLRKSLEGRIPQSELDNLVFAVRTDQTATQRLVTSLETTARGGSVSPEVQAQIDQAWKDVQDTPVYVTVGRHKDAGQVTFTHVSIQVDDLRTSSGIRSRPTTVRGVNALPMGTAYELHVPPQVARDIAAKAEQMAAKGGRSISCAGHACTVLRNGGGLYVKASGDLSFAELFGMQKALRSGNLATPSGQSVFIRRINRMPGAGSVAEADQIVRKGEWVLITEGAIIFGGSVGAGFELRALVGLDE